MAETQQQPRITTSELQGHLHNTCVEAVNPASPSFAGPDNISSQQLLLSSANGLERAETPS